MISFPCQPYFKNIFFILNTYLFLFWLCWAFTVVQQLSCPVTCGILVPWPGIEPTSHKLEGRFFTTGPSGKPLNPQHSWCLLSVSKIAKPLFPQALRTLCLKWPAQQLSGGPWNGSVKSCPSHFVSLGSHTVILASFLGHWSPIRGFSGRQQKMD